MNVLPTVYNHSPSSRFAPPHPRAPPQPHQLYFLCFWLILSHLRFWNYQWELFKSPRYEIATRRLWKTLINPKWRGAHSKSQRILSVVEIWLVTVAVLNPSWRWKLILSSVYAITQDMKKRALCLRLQLLKCALRGSTSKDTSHFGGDSSLYIYEK